MDKHQTSKWQMRQEVKNYWLFLICGAPKRSAGKNACSGNVWILQFNYLGLFWHLWL